jgi:SAM-dependent methyltransferase
VLEIGDPRYTRQFGGTSVDRSEVLHVRSGTPGATIIADLMNAPQIPTDSFDCIILTQTLQLVQDVESAIGTVHRILKPNGVVLATFPGITPISEWDNSWYWSFTNRSAIYLFSRFFEEDSLTVCTFGNVLSAAGFLYGMAAEELTQEELEHVDPSYQLVICVRARKARAT